MLVSMYHFNVKSAGMTDSVACAAVSEVLHALQGERHRNRTARLSTVPSQWKWGSGNTWSEKSCCIVDILEVMSHTRACRI